MEIGNISPPRQRQWTERKNVDNSPGSDLDARVQTGADFPMFIKLYIAIMLLCAGCTKGPTADLRLGPVEMDSTLTHAVLILENPSPVPVEVLLRRPGLLRQFIVPPQAAVRELLPAGPLLVLWKDGKIQLVLHERTRGTLQLKSTDEVN